MAQLPWVLGFGLWATAQITVLFKGRPLGPYNCHKLLVVDLDGTVPNCKSALGGNNVVVKPTRYAAMLSPFIF
jgi:hypothetical protein